MKCESCGANLHLLFSSFFCPNDCDRVNHVGDSVSRVGKKLLYSCSIADGSALSRPAVGDTAIYWTDDREAMIHYCSTRSNKNTVIVVVEEDTSKTSVESTWGIVHWKNAWRGKAIVVSVHDHPFDDLP